MKTLTLRKTADDVYEDDSEPRYKKWTRGYRTLSFDLSDAVAVQGIELHIQNVQDGSGDPLGNSATTLANALVAMSLGRPVDGNEIRDLSSIRARGTTPARDGRLRLINPNDAEKEAFREVAITVRPIPWVDTGAGEPAKWSLLAGRWGHFEGHGLSMDPPLWLDVPVPQPWFDPIWRSVMSGGFVRRLRLEVLAEAFEWEFSRHRYEHGHIDLAFERGFTAGAVIRTLRADGPTCCPATDVLRTDSTAPEA